MFMKRVSSKESFRIDEWISLFLFSSYLLIETNPFLSSYNMIQYMLFFSILIVLVVYLIRNSINKLDLSFLARYCVFFFFSVFSCAYAQSDELSTSQFVPILKILFLLLFLCLVIKNSASLKLYEYSFLAICIINLISYLPGISFASYLGDRTTIQIFGNDINVNSIAPIYSLFSIVIAAILINCGSKFGKAVLFLFFVFNFVFLLIIGSRGGVLVSFLALLVVLLLTVKLKILFPTIIVTLLLMAVLYMFIKNNQVLYASIGHRFEETIDSVFNGVESSTSDSDMYRQSLIKLGWDSFLEKPFFGYGINNFRYISGHMYAHNNYIEILVDLGIFGFLAYYLPILVLFGKIFFHRRQSPSALMFITFVLIYDLFIVSYNTFVFNYALLLAYKHFSFIEVPKKYDKSPN